MKPLSPAFIAGVFFHNTTTGTYHLQQTTGNDTGFAIIFDQAGTINDAGSFLTSGAYSLRRVIVRLLGNGSPTMTIQAEIWSSTGGGTPVPSAKLGSTSTNTVNASSIPASFTDTTFDFTTGISLSASTRYWVVLKASATNVNNNVEWAGTTTSQTENFAEAPAALTWTNVSSGNIAMTIKTYSFS